jgi:hypothetical protein
MRGSIITPTIPASTTPSTTAPREPSALKNVRKPDCQVRFFVLRTGKRGDKSCLWPVIP